MTGEGVYCDSCGVCSDTSCIKTADRKFKCKAITSTDKGPIKHHWVKGNFLESYTIHITQKFLIWEEDVDKRKVSSYHRLIKCQKITVDERKFS